MNWEAISAIAEIVGACYNWGVADRQKLAESYHRARKRPRKPS